MAGVMTLPAASVRAETTAASACRFEAAGTGKVRAIIDGRSFALDDGREIRLAAIEVPFPPRSGESGTQAAAGASARAALASILADQTVELRQSVATPDRYGRMLAFAYVKQEGAHRSAAHEMLGRGFARVSAHVGTGRAPTSCWRKSGPRAKPSLASGANRIMSSSAPTARPSLRPSGVISPWWKARCRRSARAEARFT
jgi:endonuclease YncB( thermonuclease family)